MKSKLLVYINEITETVIGFSANAPQQINIFEEVEPEELTVSGYSSVAKYKKYLQKILCEFKNRVDDNLLGIDTIIFEDLIFEIRDTISHYRTDNICGKRITICDLLELNDRSFINKKNEIKNKVSAFRIAY